MCYEISIDDLAPLPADDKLVAEFIADANQRGVSIMGSDGSFVFDLMRVKIMLQMDAIGEFCAPTPPPTPEYQAKILHYRKKYHARLAQMRMAEHAALLEEEERQPPLLDS